MASGRDLQNKSGCGEDIGGGLCSPFGRPAYEHSQGDGQGTMGQGALQGPFASPTESGSTLRGKNFENWPSQPTNNAGPLWVPMDQTPALVTGSEGGQGTGPKKGDISTAMNFPFGELGGRK